MSERADASGQEALRRLHDVIGRLNSLETLEATLQAVADGVVDVVGFEVAVVSLLHPDDVLETVAVAGSEQARAELLGTRTPLADLTREFAVAQTWGPLRFVPHENIPDGPVVGWVPSIEVPDIENAWHPLDALYAPLRNPEDDLVGILSVDLPQDRRRPGAFQRELLAMFAGHAGIAISNARISSRLSISEETFRLAFNAAGVGMSLLSLDPAQLGEFVQVNPALCRLLGYEPTELLGRTMLDITHTDDREADQLVLERMGAGATPVHTGQKRYLHSNGSSVWVEIKSTVVVDEAGTPVSTMTIVEDISERRERDRELTHMVEHDDLTGLSNRRVLLGRIAEAVEHAATVGIPGVLLFCDLDGFKGVNDAYGHAIGDHVLAVVAERIQRTIRARDVAIRIGGDEFVVVVDEIAADQVGPLVRRLEATIAEPIDVADHRTQVCVPASIGMAAIPSDGLADVDALLRSADDAMYAVKSAAAVVNG